jgi:hypothetical protein
VSHGTRITRVAWMERKPEIAWLHAQAGRSVLAINREFYSFDLYGLVEAFQYTVYERQGRRPLRLACRSGRP